MVCRQVRPVHPVHPEVLHSRYERRFILRSHQARSTVDPEAAAEAVRVATVAQAARVVRAVRAVTVAQAVPLSLLAT